MRNELKQLKFWYFPILLIAGVINAFGVNIFLMPVSLYDSGFSGTSMLLDALIDVLPMAFFLLVLNIPFFIYGFKKQGLNFTIYSIFAVVVYSASSFLITNVLPIDLSGGSPLAGNDLFLCGIFGGMISGIGSGLTIRFGGAIDGVEVLAVIFSKRLGVTVGTFVMVYNTALYIVAGIIKQSWFLPLYSIIAYCAAIKTVDFIVEGLDKAKSAMIITKKEKEISAEISETFGKGITLINAHGYYSDSQKTVIYFVVNRFQIAKLKDIVLKIDPKAFITISDVTDVLGTTIKKK